MAKNTIKLTESQLEDLVKKIMLEEKSLSSKKLKSSKSLNEGRELVLKFQKEKKRLVKEGYSKKQINEQLDDFLGGMSLDNTSSFFGDVGISSAKQWIISWIIGQLGVKDAELVRFLSIALSDISPKDYVKLLDPVDNCTFLSDVMFDTFLKIGVSKIISSFGGKVGSSGGGQIISSDIFTIVFANSIDKLTKNNEFRVDLQRAFRKVVCKLLGGYSGEVELTSDLESSDIPKSLSSKIIKNL